MILADKIVRLRKQVGWSQEELAEKMKVSRQSVSKWESAHSIPDINKIIILANLFDVSTDFLLKDENESFEPSQETSSNDTTYITLEQATQYINSKMKVAALITKGVLLCVCSVIPLLFFLAMAETNKLGITGNLATAIGMVFILGMVSMGVSAFIKINQYENDLTLIDDEKFDLAYGVHSVIQDKLEKFRPTYNQRLSISIFMFIFSFVPMVFAAMFFNGPGIVLMMLIVLFLIIAAGLYIIIPVSTKYDAFNSILEDNSVETAKSKRNKRAGKFAAFYWPLLIAVYLGWSLWTMNWGVTWIVFPVGSVLFAALVGLLELLNKDDD